MGIIRLDESHDGQTVRARVGDRIELALSENATTGYQWQVDAPDGGIDVVSSELVPPTGAGAGAAGRRHVVADAKSAGHGRLSLRLRRSWEAQDSDAQRFVVDVDVT